MSRDDRTRRTAVRAVLTYAGLHPEQGLGFARLPEVRTEFRDARDLVARLQHDWSQLLHERITQISDDPRRAHLSPAMLARVAWAETAERNQVLRRLLDTHSGLIDAGVRRREELLISRGVAAA